MADVKLTLDELQEMSDELGLIIEEFENATTRSEELEQAIGAPFGRTDLRDAVEEFETRWDVKRGDLKDSLSGVDEHLTAVIDGFEGLDSEAAIRLAENQCTPIG